MLNNSVHVFLFDIKIFKKLSEGKKIKVKASTNRYSGMQSMTTTIRTLYVHVVLNCVIFFMILFSYTIGTFYLSSFFFFPKSDYLNKLPFFVICDMRNFLKMCYLVKIGPSDLLSEHVGLFFFIDFFFETVLSRKQSGKVSKNFIGNF